MLGCFNFLYCISYRNEWQLFDNDLIIYAKISETAMNGNSIILKFSTTNYFLAIGRTLFPNSCIKPLER